ncbi:DnaJ domain-containing protein [Thermomonas sp. LB-4]|uniref:J domain-containing protein n=1 Tax=Thermomonas sp. LB-4 TaxID=3102790 RepID=UPI002ED8D5C1
MRRWYGQFLGFIAGWLLLRHPVGGLLGLLVGYAFDHDWFSPPRRGEKRRPRAQDQQADASGNADVDWAYRVFDLPANASDAEIDRAYRRLMSQYHPDRVAGAAPDLQKLAETKSREINAAYDRIRKLRKQ